MNPTTPDGPSLIRTGAVISKQPIYCRRGTTPPSSLSYDCRLDLGRVINLLFSISSEVVRKKDNSYSFYLSIYNADAVPLRHRACPTIVGWNSKSPCNKLLFSISSEVLVRKKTNSYSFYLSIYTYTSDRIFKRNRYRKGK